MHNHSDDRVTYIGRTNHRNDRRLFGIRQRDRRSHMYIVGKTGTGKSHLLQTMLLQDIEASAGCALLDPHGDLARDVVRLVPGHRRKDLVYLDASNRLQSWRFNPFAGVVPENRALAAAGIVEVFKKLWSEDWGPRLEHLLRNVAFTLLESPDSTFADIPPLLTDSGFRRNIVSRLENGIVRNFWTQEYDRYSFGFRAVVIAPLQNKIGALLTDPTSRRILTEPGQFIDLHQAMDDGQILVANLDKGRIGEGPSSMLGSLLLSHISLAGISRSDLAPVERRDFMVYADEFQTFTTLSIANMLSELRKYGICLTLAHQHLSQLETDIREAVFGNAGSFISFRVGAADASFLAREFGPRFSSDDLVNLPRYQICTKLLVDGETSQPFSAETVA